MTQLYRNGIDGIFGVALRVHKVIDGKHCIIISFVYRRDIL